MKIQKPGVVITMAFAIFSSSPVTAEGRVSTGYLSAVTSETLVLDGASYRFAADREEKNPTEVQCRVKERKIGCEELAQISQRNRMRAKVSFDRAGAVTEVLVLDALK